MTSPWLKLAGVTLLTVGGTTTTASADPVVYEIDGAHTHIVWQVDRFGFTDTVGTFTDISGTLLLDEDNPDASSVTAEIALAGLRSDLPEREDIIRGPHWLDADAHPIISFQSTDVGIYSDETCPTQCAVVTGQMTLKGATADLALKVVLNKLGTDPVTRRTAAGFTATGTFDRGQFGIDTAIGPIGQIVSFQIEALAVAEE